jgi:hypothetical protein
VKYIPNTLLAIALLLTIADLIWPTPQLLKVAVLLTIVSLIAEPMAK